MNLNDHAHWTAQKPCILWFTGVSGSGKSTIAAILEQCLSARGGHTCRIDGDSVRQGLSKDLGYGDADRVENVRRVAEVAKLMLHAGLITLVTLISPFKAGRQMARNLVEGDEFIEIFIDTPLAVAEARDPKGLYRKARCGKIPNFTGIDSPYEPPLAPEIHIDTTRTSAHAAAEFILHVLRQRGIVGAYERPRLAQL